MRGVRLYAATLVLLSLPLAGCDKASDAPVATTSEASSSGAPAVAATPEELGRLGAAIKKQPDNAQQLLTEAGLTTTTFENAIREVSSDPEKSRRYAAAFKSAQ